MQIKLGLGIWLHYLNFYTIEEETNIHVWRAPNFTLRSFVQKPTYKPCYQHLNQVSNRLFCKASVNRSKAEEVKIFFVIKITV
jgi:hypothetical protein